MFYNDIGIRYNKDKKERMITNEVESDSQRLLININDMLECRREAVETINETFGLNISVKLSNEVIDVNENLSEDKIENLTEDKIDEGGAADDN